MSAVCIRFFIGFGTRLSRLHLSDDALKRDPLNDSSATFGHGDHQTVLGIFDLSE